MCNNSLISQSVNTIIGLSRYSYSCFHGTCHTQKYISHYFFCMNNVLLNNFQRSWNWWISEDLVEQSHPTLELVHTSHCSWYTNHTSLGPVRCSAIWSSHEAAGKPSVNVELQLHQLEGDPLVAEPQFLIVDWICWVAVQTMGFQYRCKWIETWKCLHSLFRQLYCFRHRTHREYRLIQRY